LVRKAAVLNQPVAVLIEFLHLADGFLHDRPDLGQELLVFGEDIIAVDLQHEFRVEVFPFVDIVDEIAVHLAPGIFHRPANVMRNHARHLALGDFAIIDHFHHVRIFLHGCLGDIALQTQFQLRPQHGEREGGVEVYVIGVVHGVGMPFQVGEMADGLFARFAFRVGWITPDGAAVHNVVEFIEERHFVPMVGDVQPGRRFHRHGKSQRIFKERFLRLGRCLAYLPDAFLAVFVVQRDANRLLFCIAFA